MLFAVTYTPIAGTEDDQERSLQLFSNWTPPSGLRFQSHYAYVNGGGVAIVEAESAAALLEGILPFATFFDFSPTPVVDMNEAVPISQRALAWRNSVG
jgi:hypothetical protein